MSHEIFVNTILGRSLRPDSAFTGQTWLSIPGSFCRIWLISRFGTLRKVMHEFLPKSDNGLVFTSGKYTTLVRSYGLKQGFIMPQCRQPDGMVEHVIRTLKGQNIYRQCFARFSRRVGIFIFAQEIRRG